MTQLQGTFVGVQNSLCGAVAGGILSKRKTWKANTWRAYYEILKGGPPSTQETAATKSEKRHCEVMGGASKP